MKAVFLGCGSSFGCPASGGFWGACDPSEPKNIRTRASMLVQSATTNVLVDTSYDLRVQLNRHLVQKIDGVVYTHHHSDHVNGIDDLRPVAFGMGQKMQLYSEPATVAELNRRWPFLFFDNEIYAQYLELNTVNFYDRFRIGDIDIDTFEQDHVSCKSLGMRFGNFAYSVDVADLDERALSALEGVEYWAVDASAYHKEKVQTHANLKRVLGWVERLKPKMTYLTVLSTHMDYKTLCDELPPHVRPAYDGLEINLSGN